ncbi:MAG: choice-of-anchor B family protein [Bacteroidetes bacterium]|nr:choice-of-anchor B family protein [Bacteroidota bacterium]
MRLTPLFIFRSAVVILLANTGIAQQNLTLRSQLTLSQLSTSGLSNIWGYTDSMNREYALVGTETGTSIVEVTDPDTPVILFNVPGPNTSIWREITTSGSYAYVGSDQSGTGLKIIDLSYLPDSISVKTWNGDSILNGQMQNIHTLRADGDMLYIFGGTFQYPLFIDITDKWNPHYIGKFVHPTSQYVHDGYARNDTLYSAHIYAGFFSMVDVTDKSNPVLLASQNTPNNFTHNMWLSDDSRTLFTTDEQDYSYLASYDITDPNNIRELDRLQFNSSGSVVHNVHVTNDYCVNSWYKDGVVIVDCNRPNNLVTIGNFDTSPLSGTGMDGCWGVFPYFSSGTIVASDMNEGLFVLSPNYIRACYLEGAITDSGCGIAINNVLIELLSSPVISENSGISGGYALGTTIPGTFSVRISKTGYYTKIFSGVTLTNGNVTIIDAALQSITGIAVSGSVSDSFSGQPVQGVQVFMNSATDNYSFLTDASGNFSLCNIVPGSYEIVAGKWGYYTYCTVQNITSTVNIPVILQAGYYDDFSFDFGWTVSGNASDGQWVRGEPAGTLYIGDVDNDGNDDTVACNPDEDVLTDCYDFAYVTGNGGGAFNSDDIDFGNTILTSPVFDLSSYVLPLLTYYRWFFTQAPSPSAPSDTMAIWISNGITSQVLEKVVRDTADNFKWVFKSFDISSLITPTATMQLDIIASDIASGYWVEGAFDEFKIVQTVGLDEKISGSDTRIFISPNPFSHSSFLRVAPPDANNRSITGIQFITAAGKEVSLDMYPVSGGYSLINESLTPGIYFIKIHRSNSPPLVAKMIIMD